MTTVVLFGVLITDFYTHVASTACSPPLFDEFIDSSVSGGVAQSEIGTLEQCQGQCAANNECLALDWDVGASTQCWFHLNNVGSRRDSPGVVHYALVDRCPRGK